MSSFPYVFSANATMASESFAFDTSAAIALASPPALRISSTVSSAGFRSTQTIFAPSCAKRRHDALPMPDAAPVMRATLFASRISPHLEIPPPLPVGDDGVELSLFGPEEMQVVIDHVVSERLARERARL